jgi:hypothetical protein
MPSPRKKVRAKPSPAPARKSAPPAKKVRAKATPTKTVRKPVSKSQKPRRKITAPAASPTPIKAVRKPARVKSSPRLKPRPTPKKVRPKTFVPFPFPPASPPSSPAPTLTPELPPAQPFNSAIVSTPAPSPWSDEDIAEYAQGEAYQPDPLAASLSPVPVALVVDHTRRAYIAFAALLVLIAIAVLVFANPLPAATP